MCSAHREWRDYNGYPFTTFQESCQVITYYLLQKSCSTSAVLVY